MMRLVMTICIIVLMGVTTLVPAMAQGYELKDGKALQIAETPPPPPPTTKPSNEGYEQFKKEHNQQQNPTSNEKTSETTKQQSTTSALPTTKDLKEKGPEFLQELLKDSIAERDASGEIIVKNDKYPEWAFPIVALINEGRLTVTKDHKIHQVVRGKKILEFDMKIAEQRRGYVTQGVLKNLRKSMSDFKDKFGKKLEEFGKGFKELSKKFEAMNLRINELKKTVDSHSRQLGAIWFWLLLLTIAVIAIGLPLLGRLWTWILGLFRPRPRPNPPPAGNPPPPNNP